MSFIDRRKRAHLWRENPHPTAEQLVRKALQDVATGLAVDFTERTIAKAFKKFGIAPPEAVAETPPKKSATPRKKKSSNVKENRK